MNSHGNEDRLAMGGNSGVRGGIKWQSLLFELFVAFSLFVAFFFLVRNYFAYGSPMNGNLFMAGSEKLYRLNEPIMGGHWNGRLSGLLLSGALMDFSLKENGADEAQIERLSNVFGLYHAFWLLLLFVIIIFALRHSLLINLGIFAGLMYDFSPASGPYFYPWDLPATLFFTLAVLFFERRQMWLLAAATCAGSFFKETVLVCALLVLFADHWKWKKRIPVFVGILVVYALGEKFLLSQLHIAAPLLSVKDALNLHGAFSPVTLLDNFVENLKTLFLPTFNSVIFANAGTVVAVLVLGWRRRFLPYMTVILAFLAGLFLIAPPPPGISEVRAFMEILPLSLVLLSEWWTEYAGTAPPRASPAGQAPAWAVRETFPVLRPMTIALVGGSTIFAAWQYYVIFEDLQPDQQAQSELGKYIYKSGKPVSLKAVCQWFQNGYLDAELKLATLSQSELRDADAMDEYQRVLDVDTNSIFALNNLALLLATDSDPRLRDGQRAVRLAEQACQSTHYQEAIPIYTLAAACAEAGRFNDAVAAAQQARAVALAHGQTQMAKENEPLLELYKSGHAFHQEARPAP